MNCLFSCKRVIPFWPPKIKCRYHRNLLKCIQLDIHVNFIVKVKGILLFKIASTVLSPLVKTLTTTVIAELHIWARSKANHSLGMWIESCMVITSLKKFTLSKSPKLRFTNMMNLGTDEHICENDEYICQWQRFSSGDEADESVFVILARSKVFQCSMCCTVSFFFPQNWCKIFSPLKSPLNTDNMRENLSRRSGRCSQQLICWHTVFIIIHYWFLFIPFSNTMQL
jgi:hypothetical protein